MEFVTVQMEVFLRLSSTLILALTACLVAMDTQKKAIFFGMERKATVKDLSALLTLVYFASVAAGYNLLQLCYLLSSWFGGNMYGSNLYVAWLRFLLDQITVYTIFSANSAAVEASILAVTGARNFQWMKWCNKYTRFCFQIGGAVTCCYVAVVFMALLSYISAFKLFSLYSPKWFLRLKNARS